MNQTLLFRFLVFLVISLSYSTSSWAGNYWDVDSIYRNSSRQQKAYLESDGKTVKILDTSQVEMLLKVKNNISAAAGINAKLLLTDTPALNAWASSANGMNTVTLTFQMLDLIGNDADECAELLGHEFTHLKLNHGAKQEAADFLLNLLAAIAGGIVDAKLQVKSGIPQTIGRDISSIAAQGFSSAYSRDDERQADEYGTKWMMQAGYNPQGAISLHEKFMRRQGDNHSFLSTHPSSNERVNNVRQIIAQYDPTKVAASNAPNPVSAPTSDTPVESFTNLPGQIGVILKVKDRYNYFIFSGTTSNQLVAGEKVYVLSANNEKIPAKIERAVDGYYSASYENSTYAPARGEKVLIEGGRQ